jgi:hypothetical protein
LAQWEERRHNEHKKNFSLRLALIEFGAAAREKVSAEKATHPESIGTESLSLCHASRVFRMKLIGLRNFNFFSFFSLLSWSFKSFLRFQSQSLM